MLATMTPESWSEVDELGTRAEQLVGLLRSALPCTAALLAYRRPGGERLHALTSWGYPAEVAEYLLDDFVREDPFFPDLVSTPRRCRFWEDVSGFRDGRTAGEVLLPNGYCDGSTIVLTDASHALVGVAHLSLGPGTVPPHARSFLGQMRSELAATAEAASVRDRWGLTPRELDVLAHLADGLTNPDAARRLGVTRRTVATHVENILHKLGVDNRVAAVTAALRAGVLPSRRSS